MRIRWWLAAALILVAGAVWLLSSQGPGGDRDTTATARIRAQDRAGPLLAGREAQRRPHARSRRR